MTGEATSSHRTGAGLVHEALLYRGREELRDVLRGFLRTAARAGEPVLVALPGPTLRRVREALAEAAPAATLKNISEVGRNPGRLFPMLQQWIETHAGPGVRVRVACETVWPGRTRSEIAECLRQEAVLNLVMAGTPVTIMCAYDAVRLGDEALDGAQLTHPTVLEAGGRRRSDFYDPGEQGALADQWPLDPPPEPVVEHRLQESLSALRHEIAADPILGGLDAERRADLVLAVNEAIVNAVRHGARATGAALWHDGDGVVAEVRSRSQMSDTLVGRRRPDPEAPSGRGLWLINEVCDLVELRSGEDGTTVRMHVRDQ